MTPQRAGVIAGVVGAAAAVAWLLFVGLPRWTKPAPVRPAAVSAPDAPPAAPKIRVRLYYLAPSGTSLQIAEREVEASDAPAIQARRII